MDAFNFADINIFIYLVFSFPEGILDLFLLLHIAEKYCQIFFLQFLGIKWLYKNQATDMNKPVYKNLQNRDKNKTVNVGLCKRCRIREENSFWENRLKICIVIEM